MTTTTTDPVSIGAYRAQARAMLDRWGKEVAEGRSRPNVLAMVLEEAGGGGMRGWPVPVGAMFSPLAERADKVLFDLTRLDSGLGAVLVAIAIGLSAADIGRSFAWGKSKAQNEMDSAMAAFATAVWYRSKEGRWREYCDCRQARGSQPQPAG